MRNVGPTIWIHTDGYGTITATAVAELPTVVHPFVGLISDTDDAVMHVTYDV